MIELAIVEDDVELSVSLKEYLLATNDFKNIKLFASVELFLAELKVGYKPNLVLQDIQLPGMSGIEALDIYKRYIPDSKILMNSVLQNSESIFAALCSGALGYLEKGYSLQKIHEAIIDLHNGGSPMSPAIARHVINYFNPRKKFEEDLSPKELEVVQGILNGASYKQIADKQAISIDTVRTHITRIYRKLQVNSKGELIAKYLNSKSK
jgi:DNA-binding NarL/FixJ family response regulator